MKFKEDLKEVLLDRRTINLFLLFSGIIIGIFIGVYQPTDFNNIYNFIKIEFIGCGICIILWKISIYLEKKYKNENIQPRIK